MSILVPHPWDKYGEPPYFAEPYQVESPADGIGQEELRALLDDARNEARDEARDEVEDHPGLLDAVEDLEEAIREAIGDLKRKFNLNE